MPKEFGDRGSRFTIGGPIRRRAAAHRWRDTGDRLVLVAGLLMPQPVATGADVLAGDADLGQHPVVVCAPNWPISRQVGA